MIGESEFELLKSHFAWRIEELGGKSDTESEEVAVAMVSVCKRTFPDLKLLKSKFLTALQSDNESQGCLEEQDSFMWKFRHSLHSQIKWQIESPVSFRLVRSAIYSLFLLLFDYSSIFLQIVRSCRPHCFVFLLHPREILNLKYYYSNVVFRFQVSNYECSANYVVKW